LKTGKEVKMPRGYDEMTDHALADYAGGTPEERWPCSSAPSHGKTGFPG
jgi:hypothetical protein